MAFEVYIYKFFITTESALHESSIVMKKRILHAGFSSFCALSDFQLPADADFYLFKILDLRHVLQR